MSAVVEPIAATLSAAAERARHGRAGAVRRRGRR